MIIRIAASALRRGDHTYAGTVVNGPWRPVNTSNMRSKNTVLVECRNSDGIIVRNEWNRGTMLSVTR